MRIKERKGEAGHVTITIRFRAYSTEANRIADEIEKRHGVTANVRWTPRRKT